VLSWFAAAAADQRPGRGPLDAAAKDLSARREDIGSLVSPAARDLDAARAELLELQAQLAILRREQAQIRALIDSVEPD
jgi:hypothetical protein